MIFYRKLMADTLIKKVLKFNRQQDESLYEEIVSELIERAYELELSGNLLKKFICYKMITDENVFTLAAEKQGEKLDETLRYLALKEIKELKKLFHINAIDIHLQENKTEIFDKVYEVFNEDRNDEEVLDTLIAFYHTYGAGKMNHYPAFKWDTTKGLIGIRQCDPIRLEDLVGCDDQKQALISNTEKFLAGKEANNALLFGDRGTGKSSAVKALLNKYFNQRLRIIELSKSDFKDFNEILKCIKHRGMKFILFLDDLSFEEFETEYKYMKALIEGGIEIKPVNVLIYATSNRRHLIRETWEERQGEDVHIVDTRQEKLSLSDRFGLSLTFTSPNQNIYLEMVYKMAHQYHIELPENLLREKALQWELMHGGRSGRVAKQFIQSLL